MAQLSIKSYSVQLHIWLCLLIGSLLPSASAAQRNDAGSANQPSEPSFRNHIQPILAKFGCSSGACHGAAAGQNGFRLSLRGYDDEGDFLALTRHALGRRITPSDPGRSLLLLKATATVPHKGGKKFEVDSQEYRLLADWIAAGTPGPKADDPRIERIEILPPHVVLQPGDTQPMQVRAYFNDGRVEDVTRWTKYTDSNSAVTQVGEDGQVTVMGYGEGAITAWYLSRIAIATVTAPFTNEISKAVFAGAPRRNFIDDLVLEKLEELSLPASARSSDTEFLRRAFLDTLGTLPTPDEVRAFLKDSSTDKRDRLIEQLLERPEYVDYWTHKWSDLLLVSSAKLRPAAMWSYHDWIRRNVAANTPWDQFVRRIVTATGSTIENGAANFFVLHENPKPLAETISVAFLGTSINCAQCHNHPMEKWTNDDYYSMANLFSRVRSKTLAGDGNNLIFVADRGDLVQPLTGRPRPPAPLESEPIPLEDTRDRREYLAEWLTSPDNTYFSRAIVNRVWANFMGRGLVEPVDDMRMTNPASNEQLLAALADYLVKNKFDLKSLMRAILQSETYQRSSEPLPGNVADDRFYSRYYPKRLMAEVMLDAASQVTGVPTQFITDLRNANRGLGDQYPLSFRAIQLPDSQIDSYFLRTFGRPAREQTCECERTEEPSITQVLHIANGETFNKKLSAKGNRIEQLFESKSAPAKIIEEAYLSCVSRYPTKTEKARMLSVLKETPAAERRAVVEDIYWALLSSKEFLFNH